MVITAETDLERAVMEDRDWIAGGEWGVPRPGHPEGLVAVHLGHVLENIDRIALDATDRERLRFVALCHDHFKYQVDRSRERVGENHHGMLGRRFAEKHTNDQELLDVIELHDEAFLSWKKGDRSGNWEAAEARAHRLIERLGDSLSFYLRFFRCDNETGSKEPTSVKWFEQLAGESA